ncbi:hypothetical protein V8E54_009854 [Elaphomyces granulatus]|jgi:hypothetical protein
MKFLGFAYLAVFLGVSSAQQIQVNYYSDSSCSNFVGQVETSVGSCYNYNYGQSLLIASCSSGCDCTFYADENCQNPLVEVSGTGQCVTDGSEINSFYCYDS